MTKRIFSILVAMTMLFSCMTFVSMAADTRYDGIKYFQSAEDMLTALNQDSDSANSAMWDYTDRTAQQEALDNANALLNADFEGAGLVEKWSDYCARILTRDSDSIGSRDGNVINYLKLLSFYNTADASLSADRLAVKNEFKAVHDAPEYDVTGLSLQNSLAKLDNYTTQMGIIISKNRAVLDAYTLSEEEKTEYMLHGTKALYQIAFQKKDSEMRDAFEGKFLGDDDGKKIIAVMYGKALTTELATDNVSTVLISFVNDNFVNVKNEFGAMVKKPYGEDTEKALFDFFKKTVVKAYKASSASDEVKADIVMLFGDDASASDKGALQMMFETMGASKTGSYGMINTWFNLFLRQHTQLSVSGTKATNLAKGVDAATSRITVNNNSSVAFNAENLDRYGIVVDSGLLSLGSDWLDLKIYNEDHTVNSSVTYSESDGKLYVEFDAAKPATYNAYIQLVRNDGTYIETYPVTINNTKSPTRPPSGGTAKVEYTITYVTNGGSEIPAESYSKGANVKLTKVPVKSGFVFEGWYTDAELTNNVTKVVVNSDITLYAKWVEDNGTAGGNHPTPDALNGDNHFAYVIGYPDGTVRPENNITRAEVASVFFRLLKDDVRTANLTEENGFADVNGEDWFNTAISTLVKLGIVNGRTATEFVPNAPITRAEFATICSRFEDSDYVVTDSFTDISGHWAESYIREAAARGWIKGYEDNTFRSDKLITRAETMTLINRILNRAPETAEDLLSDMVSWSDNLTSSWYYIAVQEATNSHSFEKKNNVYEKWTSIMEGTDWTKYEK